MSWTNAVSQTEASYENASYSPKTSDTEQQHQNITPFLSKLYDLLATCNSSLIEWTNSGDCFQVTKPTEFAHHILPKYYKHNNFSSFVRQLNQYGFRKMDKERWLFHHPCFKRGRKDLLSQIGRRKSNQRHKTTNQWETKAIRQGNKVDVKSGEALDTKSELESGFRYVDRVPVKTELERNQWDWLYRELVSSIERQRKLSYLVELDEHKLESLEKQLWCMKKWMSEYIPKDNATLDTMNEEFFRLFSQDEKPSLLHLESYPSESKGDSSPNIMDKALEKEFALEKKNILSMKDVNSFQSKGGGWKHDDHGRNNGAYPAFHNQPVELEPLSEQESTEYTEWFSNWQLDGKVLDMSSLSGSGGSHSDCSNEFQ